jgi:hypothetical protein
VTPAGERPGWYRLTWFLGRPPELTPRQWRVLGLVAIVSLFEQYDLYLFSLSLVQIQADLGIAEEKLGLLGSFVRIGGLLALPVGGRSCWRPSSSTPCSRAPPPSRRTPRPSSSSSSWRARSPWRRP